MEAEGVSFCFKDKFCIGCEVKYGPVAWVCHGPDWYFYCARCSKIEAPDNLFPIYFGEDE